MKTELTYQEILELQALIITHIQWLTKDLPADKELPPKVVRLFALLSKLSTAF